MRQLVFLQRREPSFVLSGIRPGASTSPVYLGALDLGQGLGVLAGKQIDVAVLLNLFDNINCLEQRRAGGDQSVVAKQDHVELGGKKSRGLVQFVAAGVEVRQKRYLPGANVKAGVGRWDRVEPRFGITG